MHIRAPKKKRWKQSHANKCFKIDLIPAWGIAPSFPALGLQVCHQPARVLSFLLRAIDLHYSKFRRHVFLKPHPQDLIPTSKSSTWLAGYVARSSVTWTDTSRHRLGFSCLTYRAHYAHSVSVYLYVGFIYLFSYTFMFCMGMLSFI